MGGPTRGVPRVVTRENRRRGVGNGLSNLFGRVQGPNIVGFQARVVPPGAFPGVLLGSRRRGVDRGLLNLFLGATDQTLLGFS